MSKTEPDEKTSTGTNPVDLQIRMTHISPQPEGNTMMNRHPLRRTGALAAAALTLSLGLTACGGDDTSEDTAADTPSSSAPAEEPSMDAPSEDMTEETSPDAGMTTEVFGPACSSLPQSGAGSLDGMAAEPVATAASANPLLSTLVTAVGEAGLVDTLNSAEALTVFAPTNDAFAKLPKADLDAVLADKEMLTQILTHHVVGEKLSPDMVAGEHETLNGDMITVEGSGEEFKVAGDNSAVLCGNIQTANATVYVVDTVLMP